MRYAQQRGRKVLVALNTYPRPGNWKRWTAAVDRAADPASTPSSSPTRA